MKIFSAIVTKLKFFLNPFIFARHIMVTTRWDGFFFHDFHCIIYKMHTIANENKRYINKSWFVLMTFSRKTLFNSLTKQTVRIGWGYFYRQTKGSYHYSWNVLLYCIYSNAIQQYISIFSIYDVTSMLNSSSYISTIIIVFWVVEYCYGETFHFFWLSIQLINFLTN